MNNNLIKCSEKATQLKSLLSSIENSITKVQVLSESLDELNNTMNLLYLAEDVASEIIECTEKLQGDEKVVDVLRNLNEMA